MSILRSPDCINSSDSHFHSSAPSRIETFVNFHRCSEDVGRVVEHWKAGKGHAGP